MPCKPRIISAAKPCNISAPKVIQHQRTWSPKPSSGGIVTRRRPPACQGPTSEQSGRCSLSCLLAPQRDSMSMHGRGLLQCTRGLPLPDMHESTWLTLNMCRPAQAQQQLQAAALQATLPLFPHLPASWPAPFPRPGTCRRCRAACRTGRRWACRGQRCPQTAAHWHSPCSRAPRYSLHGQDHAGVNRSGSDACTTLPAIQAAAAA